MILFEFLHSKECLNFLLFHLIGLNKSRQDKDCCQKMTFVLQLLLSIQPPPILQLRMCVCVCVCVYIYVWFGLILWPSIIVSIPNPFLYR